MTLNPVGGEKEREHISQFAYCEKVFLVFAAPVFVYSKARQKKNAGLIKSLLTQLSNQSLGEEQRWV